MPKPNLKDKNQKQNIIGKQLKDIIPSSFPHVRDPKEIEYPQQGEKIYTPEYLPIDLFPEWSNAETDLENLQKSLVPENEEESGKKYTDPMNDKVLLPISLFTDYLNMNIKWSPPENYITEIYLDKLIQKQMPKKNPFRFRAKVHECYEEELKIRQKNLEKKNNEGGEENENENNIQNSEESESDIDKKDEFFIYRDFFKILDQQLEIKVVNFITRMETEEEMNERIKKQEEELQQQMLNDKNKKGKKHAGKNPGNEIVQEKIELTLPSPNNISLKENIPPFSRWLGSIFQIIKDRNLLDVKTGENIWQKIYPQKNGVPVYNKNGHYVVKLYHMGKLRKIEIDDRMPVSQNDEFFFPRCESLEELWPALLTKALIKLYSYKIISSKFFDVGDAEPFYALTGYIPTIFKEIKINNNKKIYEDNHNQSKIIETDSKKDESSNKEKNNENENKNNLNDSLEKNNNNEIKEENGQKKEENIEEIPKEKIEFLEKALTDENYSNSNYLVECFKTIDNNFYKVQNDLNNLEEEEEEQIIEQMHANNILESQENPKKENINEIIPEEDHNDIKVIDNNIESMPDDNTKKTLNAKAAAINKQNNFLNSMKNKLTMTSDFSMTDYNKLEFKRIHEKLEDYSMENNLYKGILYDIVDFFDNKEYNMNRLQPIDFSDLKAMLKNFNKNNVFKQLSKEEKKEYISNLKEIKEKQRFLKAQRIESLKLKGPQYYSVKIQNKGIEPTSYKAKYIEQEYQMAKKCLLNKWEFPPMDYLDKRYEEKKALQREKELQEEMEQEEKNKKKKKKDKDKEKKLAEKKEIEEKENKENKEKRTWSKEIYMQLINNNTEQFNESVSPITRSEGYWIESNIFFNSFNNFIVLYNPSKYNTVFNWDNYWSDTSDVLTPKEENSVLYLKKITQPKIENTNPNPKDKKDKNDHPPVEEIVIKNEIPCNYLVLMYETISDKKNKLRNLPFKINFRFVKKDEKYENGKIIKIDSFYGSERIDGLNENSEYFLIFEGGVFPEGFFVKVVSDFSISPLNYQNFFSNHQGFNKQTFHVEHNALQKNEIYVLLRVSILNEARSKFMIISNNTKDKYSNEFIKINICDITNRNTKKNVEFKTFFELNPGEYMLVMTINPIYVLDSNSYDVDILSYSDISNSIMMDVSQTNTAVPGEQNKPLGLTMEQIETVAPYEIIDNYHHNKNNILFKEFIFAGDKISALFHIKMIKLINENFDENGNERVVEKNDKSKNKLNAASKNNNVDANETHEKQDNSLDDLVRLKLELFNKENELILTEDFYNEITLHNLVFEGNVIENTGNKGAKKLDKKSLEANANTPPSNLPYRLICKIDTSEAPSQYLNANYLRNIGWCIRVFSTDTLGFCQDTSKEDKEKEIISSWEEKEPGRAELAKKSRKRFLLQQKLSNGNQLSEEEVNFLKEQRIRKVFNKPEEEKEDDKKGKKKVEKVDKSKKKGKEIQEKSEADKDKENFANLNLNINYEKKTSSVQNHSSLFIKNFLSYAYDNRMLTYNSNYEQEDKELNNEILTTEKEEKINAQFIESEKQNTEKMNQDTKIKEEFKKNNKKMFDKMMNHRRKEVEECKSFYETRTSLAMNIQNKIILEKKCKSALNALINSEHIAMDDPKNKKKGAAPGNDLEEAINIYNEAEKVGLKSEIVEKLFDQISTKKEEIYKNEINKPPDAKNKNKDLKGVANKILNEINNSKWKISKEFIEELNKIKST